MKFLSQYTLIVLSFVLMLALFPSGCYSQWKVIKAGSVLDVRTGKVKKNQLVLIQGKQIQKIGSKLDIPEGAEVIDLSDKTLLPGLMDCHTHLCWDVEEEGYALSIVTHTTGYRVIQGVMNARDMLQAGFTTVRDVGNSGNYACTDLRVGIEKGMVSGPTVINAGRLITPYGGQRWVIPERRDFTQPEYYFADTKDEIKKAIRENIHFGAKVIKLVVDDQQYMYSEDDIRFAVEEAAKAGLKVAAHCATEQGARNAIAAGVASIEHGFQMTSETFALAKDKGIYFVSTTFSLPVFKSMWYKNPEQMYKTAIATLKSARESGVRVAFGSDVISTVPGYNRGTATLTYIDSHLDAGYKPLEIIQSMTLHAANLIGVEQQRGFLEEGMMADIIATDKNPLENIHTLKKVNFVMKEGQVYKKGN